MNEEVEDLVQRLLNLKNLPECTDERANRIRKLCHENLTLAKNIFPDDRDTASELINQAMSECQLFILSLANMFPAELAQTFAKMLADQETEAANEESSLVQRAFQMVFAGWAAMGNIISQAEDLLP